MPQGDGRVAVAAFHGGIVLAWDFPSGALRQVLRGQGPRTTAAVSHDGRLLLTSDYVGGRRASDGTRHPSQTAVPEHRPTGVGSRRLNETAKLALELGDHNRARDDCRTALATHERHGNRGGEAAVREVLGHIDHTTGDHHAAIRHYQRALALYRGLGSTSEAATTLDHLGRAHAALGQHRQARAAWEEAAAHYREQGSRSDALHIQERLDALAGHV